MKQRIKKFIASVLRNRIVWFVIRIPCEMMLRIYSRLSAIRGPATAQEQHEAAQLGEKCNQTFADNVVLSGPFEGMKYPVMRAFGSAFYPKLLGSYERELHDVIRSVTSRSYDAVVDIGCAEGYYAIGLGRHFPQARIFAFDTDQAALEQCRAMATANGVQVITGGFCDKAVLVNLDLGRKSLIISDCEGYENHLFDEPLAQRMKQHDFLIETHDFIRLESTRNMMTAFEKSHDCTLIFSVDDVIKAYDYDVAQLEHFSLKERWQVLREGRPTIMRWLFASVRT